MLSVWGDEVHTLILVKHSLPEIVENVPASEWELSTEGQSRCKRLADCLVKYQPNFVVSSVEPKAWKTAEILATELRLSAQVIEGLHEHDRNNVGYLPGGKFQDAIREFFARPDELVFGSETAAQTHQRFQIAINSILSRFPGRTIVVVAHGTVISLFVSRLTGISDLFLWKELGLPSFVVLDMQSNSLLIKENIQ